VSELSELHRDALGELFNLGVGRAAHSLSQMVRDEIELSAPFVDLIRSSEVSAVLVGSEFKELSMVTIDFEGPFVSKAILLFPERNALAILSNMLDPELTPRGGLGVRTGGDVRDWQRHPQRLYERTRR
jgi:chemotaxis protein CheC